MLSLDSKDKKIIYYLIKNSRDSLGSIGKKIEASKELVSYRIKRLIENKIIHNYSILLNFEKLGYLSVQTHYKFININPKIKAEIIKFLVNNKHTINVNEIEGNYDLQVDFFLGKPQEFEKLLDELRIRYQPYLIFKNLNPCIGTEFYPYSFLLENTQKKELDIKWLWGQELITIDRLDLKILGKLSKNARIQTKKIANELKISVNTVNSRIKKMENKRIIEKYTINIDWSKLGYRWYNLEINLSNYNKKGQIIDFMSQHPNLISRFNFLNLDMDLHFNLLLKNMQQLREIIEDISNNFPNSINDYHFYSTYKIYKYNFMIPEILYYKNPINRGCIS
jgi:DNA-binding Lrp family transcriptional regulator